MLAIIRAKRPLAVRNRLPNQRCRPLCRSQGRWNTMMDTCAAQQTVVGTSWRAPVGGSIEHPLFPIDWSNKGRAGGGRPERDGPK